jgi:uncharacterized iron-regulated protein
MNVLPTSIPRVGAVLLLLVVGLMVALVACAPTTDEVSWQSSELVQHPLVGTIWDTRTETVVSRDALLDAASDADFVLLGEIHDNLDHHQLQRDVLEALVARGERPAVVFEMLERPDQAAIDALRQQDPLATAALSDTTRFAARGWEWEWYEPLFATVLDNDLPLLAGNAPADQVQQVARTGSLDLESDQQATLGLGMPLPEPGRAQLVEQLVAGHCGYLPAEMTAPLVDAQRLRDATMADVLLAAPADLAILIAGNGHVRTDHGVPVYLQHRRPSAQVHAIGFIEVQEGQEEPQAYFPSATSQALPFDYLWFTPRAQREDPCVQFRESLEQMESPQTTPAPAE